MVPGPTGTGWPGGSPTERARWTDAQIKRAVATALQYGQTIERQRIATGMAELDASERAAGARQYAVARASAQAEMAVLAAGNGKPWEGVGPKWRPWTPQKAARYQALLDSWEEVAGPAAARPVA